jgi:hypothetical protein
MQSTPRIGEPGQVVSGGTARPGVIESVLADGTVKAIQSDVTGSGPLTVTLTAYTDVPFVPVGGTPPATGRYFQQVDYSA